ncbi:MAG: MTH1187 family thiamine-binding protein [Pseudomonadota bacterium]
MKVVADVCVTPLTLNDSMAEAIAQCQIIFAKHQLKHNLHACGTNLEGEWDTVMTAIKECHQTLHARGIAKISSAIKISTRSDHKPHSIDRKIASVRELV